MKSIILTFLLALTSYTLTAQVTEDWVSPDDYYGKNAVMITADASDNVFTLSDIFFDDMYLTKRDPFGNILWSIGYDNTEPSQWEVASDVTIDINGDAIVTGYTNTGFGSEWYPYQVVTMKFNGEDGALIWRETYHMGTSYYRGRKVLTDAEGNIYVGGDVNAWMISYNQEIGNMMVKKYDTDGNEIWTVTANELGGAMNGPLHSMKFDNAGNIVISGASPAGYGLSLAKMTSAGSVLWSKSFDSFGFSDIAIDPSNNIFLLYTYSFGVPPINMNPAVVKYSPAGVELWTNNYDFGSAEIGRQILCDGNGGAFIMGYGSQLAGMPYVDWITFRINSSGTMQWSQRYNEHENNDEWPWMMAIDDDNNIYVTGQGGPWPGYFWTSLTQMVTIKYTLDGTEEWVALHTEYSSVGQAICLASDNSIYAAGQGYAVTIHYTQLTPVICDPPTGLITNNITTTNARLKWMIEPGAFQYEVWYKKVSAINWKKKFVPGINNKLNLKNLVCNTNYVWKIRTICDTVGVDVVSDFSPDQLFTTMPCREEFVMEDNISIYPNPAIDNITVVPGDITIRSLQIVDMTGNIVLHLINTDDETISIDVGDVPAGTYILTMQTEDSIVNKQIIITK